ncbi:alpha-glucosidase [Sporocytophaga myxococcoides]|uniref:Alpha-glucosidase n=1 Tax=Sporocytophaga myxococcoides TaxID=153721 RepID=A0A098LFX6_9BACT|nr:glycoside hydrolase family 97 protein [Sporocytophaga myxococcoides]GAL85875.1 alpha-glucosidase [Sporocytophaga myxococcoides]
MKLQSPDGQLIINIEESETGIILLYEYQRKSFLKCSLGGFDTTEGKIGEHLKLRSIERVSSRENYNLYSGKSSKAIASYNQIILHCQDRMGSRCLMDIVLRAYNEGLAFCYSFPQSENHELHIINENNYYTPIPSDLTLWPMYLDSFTTNYEEIYQKQSISELLPERLIAMPLLIQNEELGFAITEASLIDYAGSYLKWDAEAKSIYSTLSHSSDDLIAVRKTGSFQTPWRVVVTGNHAGKLIESNLLYHLSTPSKVANAQDWIKPGKYAWDWWSNAVVKQEGISGGMNTDTIKYYIDFASSFNLEYMLIDAGWYGKHDDIKANIIMAIPELNLPEVIEYAKEKNIGILLWLNWRCVKRQMHEAFPIYKQWGIKGIKMDYMDRDDQEMVRFYVKVTELAADNCLLVNMHGAHKPSGVSRTYPNLLTYEGVRGNEYNKWSYTKPSHHVTIPYTRMLAGPMDFTPGAFRNVSAERHKSVWEKPMAIGTRCSQLAMYVVYESALQSLCDHPDAYNGQEGSDFLKIVPTSWDETIFLKGEVGQYIVLARKKGKQWFIGGMTNEEERFVEIDLSVLGGKLFNYILYKDIPESKVNQERLHVEKGTNLSGPSFMIWMAPGGGMAGVLNDMESH